MGYLGLIPSEDSSGEHRHQGAITKAGNSSARRALVEAAWAYQYTAKVSRSIARRQTELPKAAHRHRLESASCGCAPAFAAWRHVA